MPPMPFAMFCTVSVEPSFTSSVPPTLVSLYTVMVAVASLMVALPPTSMPPSPPALVVTVSFAPSFTSRLPSTFAVFFTSMVAVVSAFSISALPKTSMPPLLESTSSFAALVTVRSLAWSASPTCTSPATSMVTTVFASVTVALPITVRPPVPPSVFFTVSSEPLRTSSVPRSTASFLPSSVPFRLRVAFAPLSSLASVFTIQLFDVVTRLPSAAGTGSSTVTVISVCVSARMFSMISLLSARPSSTWFAMMAPAAFSVARLTRVTPWSFTYRPAMTMWLKPMSPLLSASVFFV